MGGGGVRNEEHYEQLAVLISPCAGSGIAADQREEWGGTWGPLGDP